MSEWAGHGWGQVELEGKIKQRKWEGLSDQTCQNEESEDECDQAGEKKAGSRHCFCLCNYHWYFSTVVYEGFKEQVV